MATVTEVADAIRDGLLARAQPDKAEEMRAYLKSDLPCLGTYSKERRAAVNAGLALLADLDRDAWMALIRDLWDEPTHREQRQAAVDVLVLL